VVSSSLTLSVGLSVACCVAVGVLLLVDRLELGAWRAVAKLTASTLFVLVAWSLGALRSAYGQWIVAALCLGWLGDALLLSRAPKAFMGGLLAFLLSHLALAAAFASSGLWVATMAVATLPALGVGAIVLRWLLPHTPADFKLPVVAYVVVILAMCVAAAAYAAATGHWAALLGALMFASSDLAVARDRFVQPGHINRLWGWPMYFAAQLVLAWTVAGAAVAHAQ
jgi:uncharacterized membrane protein YhhN